jgi:uncharacterized protein (UPF0335 family)
MDIKKADLEAFFSRLESLEADKKEIADEMKEAVEAFASNYELSKKSVNKAFKAYKEAKRDKDDFVLVDAESDQLILIAFPEFSTEEVKED